MGGREERVRKREGERERVRKREGGRKWEGERGREGGREGEREREREICRIFISLLLTMAALQIKCFSIVQNCYFKKE